MKKFWSLLALALLLGVFTFCASCYDPPVSVSEQLGGEVNYWVGNMVYAKDPRTDLCFAYFGTGGTGGPALANVPCTEAVLRQIPAAKR